MVIESLDSNKITRYISDWDNIYCEKYVSNLIKLILEKINQYYINDNLCVIDIGSNVGKIYDLLSEKIALDQYYMFEPDTNLYEYITYKYKNNSNIKIYNNAVGLTTDFVYFNNSSMEYQINNNKSNLNFGLGMISNKPTNQQIKGIKISDFFRNNSFLYEKPCFIKIDTENFDYQILSDLSHVIDFFIKKPIIIFENNYFCNGNSLEWAQDIVNLFFKKGYKKINITRSMGDGILEV